MAKDTIGFLDRIIARPVPIIGYSAIVPGTSHLFG